jgi:hypothetical protein
MSTISRQDRILQEQLIELGEPVAVSKYLFENWSRPFVITGADGLAPAATGKHMMLCGSGNMFTYYPIVGQTLGMVWNDPGLNIAGDQNADDGWELIAGMLGASNPYRFIVGTDPAFFMRVKFSIADVSGSDDCSVGFRKLEAHQAAIDNYDEMATLNVISGAIYTETIKNNAATVATDTTETWADLATHTLEVRVSAAGVVTYRVDNDVPGTVVAYSFDAGEVVIPFLSMLQATDLSGAVVIQEFESGYLTERGIGANSWK